jgi:hypothetical protein
MPTIPFPPRGLVNDKGIVNFDTCVAYKDDPLSISFQDAVMVVPTATGVFRPDIVPGIFDAGETIGPFAPINGNAQLVVYFGDFKNQKLYKNTITIKATCP